ncbi:hypothetical protein [Paenibacillus sp. FSL M7-1046]
MTSFNATIFVMTADLRLSKVCSLDYYNNRLFIPEWDGELII